MKTVAIVYSKTLDNPNPFAFMGSKESVYHELMKKLSGQNVNPVVVSKKTYQGSGVFLGYWQWNENSFAVVSDSIQVDVAYDRSGGLAFPVTNDSLRVVDSLEFKQLAWDKWKAYQLLEKYMASSFLVNEQRDLISVLSNIQGEMVVLKPHNGLKGREIYIGSKDDASDFQMPERGLPYIAQEFVETKGGIPQIVEDRHDLRVVVINKKIVWAHVRIPVKDSYTANVAQEGELREVGLDLLPESVVNVANEVAGNFYNKFDNPVFSIDFGIENGEDTVVFEINDQLGFPKPEMENKDNFLDELVQNLISKI